MVYVPVYLSVMFLHCAQIAEDTDNDIISFAYESPMSFLDRIKIWLTSVNCFFPTVTPTPPVDSNVWNIQWQIVAEWLEIV